MTKEIIPQIIIRFRLTIQAKDREPGWEQEKQPAQTVFCRGEGNICDLPGYHQAFNHQKQSAVQGGPRAVSRMPGGWPDRTISRGLRWNIRRLSTS